MNKSQIFFALLLFCLQSNAQESKTYALVIGISEYEEIKPLDYAHRDAIAFAEFLQSPNGGLVPKENITLLLNKEANFTAIGLALRNLTNIVEKNDRVYIFFSGHGDVENETTRQGFLLAANTPQQPYIMNAVSVAELNNVVAILSTRRDREAQVILITDACHSGKGIQQNLKGTQLAAEQLRTAKNNELRISSCAPDELSYEDERWGDGSGIFSYYLIKGLNGAAATNPEGFVALEGIKNYLQQSFANDEVLKQKGKKQTPGFSGNAGFVLNKPVNNNADSMPLKLMKQIEQPLSSWFFLLIQQLGVENAFDYKKLDSVPEKEIPFFAIDLLLVAKDSFIQNNPGISFEFNATIASDLKKVLKENPYKAKQFNEKLAEVFSETGQYVINAYLKGDIAELEKREYYNAISNNYGIYPKMFSIALKLIREKGSGANELERQLQVKQYYFYGIVERLKMAATKEIKSLLSNAIGYQLKALAIEEDAPFVQNELGILYGIGKDVEKSQTYFYKATELSPGWALPWVNLAALYYLKNLPDSGILLAEKAIALQKNFYGGFFNMALLFEKKNNLLAAEEYYQKSIRLNSVYYLPYQALGLIYLKTNKLIEADSFLFAASIRKKENYYEPGNLKFAKFPKYDLLQMTPYGSLAIDYTIVAPNNTYTFLVLGLEYLLDTAENNNYVAAEKWFRKAIAANDKNHLAYHYLGRALFFQKRWQEAALNFKFAAKNWIPNKEFSNKMDSALLYLKTPDALALYFKIIILDNLYPQIGDAFCLGDNYTQWGRYDDAEQQFKKAIILEPELLAGYYKLWILQEWQGKYTDAENTILSYKNTNPLLSAKYLSEFYLRITQRLPENAYWHYKAGNFNYFLLENSEEKNVFDYKMPDVEALEYTALTNTTPIDFNRSAENYRLMQSKVQRYYLYEQENLTPDKRSLLYSKGFSKPGIEIPGTREIIYTPEYDLMPYTYGEKFLSKAEALLQAEETSLADINTKIGNLFSWQNKNTDALAYFEKANFFQPDNNNTRIKYIETCLSAFENKKAFDQLDHLERQQKTDLQLRILRTRLLILQSRFTESEIAFSQLMESNEDSTISAAINDLKIMEAILKNDTKNTIAICEKKLQKNPKDSLQLYLLATVYAKNNKKVKAMELLKKAIGNGFNLKFVINEDPAWRSFRNKVAWNNLVKKIVPKAYN